GILTVTTISSLQADLSIQIMQWAFCFSILLIGFIVLTIWEYGKIGNKHLSYIQWNKEKKRDRFTKMWLFSNTGYLSSEIKEQFWEFGYSENDGSESSN
ncbi:MAG: hypothetical protein AB1750_16060, partial [Chloroflexota bacterium]